MRKSRQRGLTALVMLGTIIGLPLATTGSAAAANGTIPGGQETCSSGQPKLDYEFGLTANDGFNYSDEEWANVCGTGTWNWDVGNGYDGDWGLVAVRMPTTPGHRVWLHQYANNTGWSYCINGTDTDFYVPVGGPNSGAYQYELPGNVQVSANTASC
jgi:hypothetical protein